MSSPDSSRRQQSFDVRVRAARLARDRDHALHKTNGDEHRYCRPDGAVSLIASFTKGLPHDRRTGVVQDPTHFDLFVAAVNSGDERDIRNIPLGPQGVPNEQRFQSGMARASDDNDVADVRAWESMAAGNAFDLQGPDAQTHTMPPPPNLESEELVAEITENYWMALLRDVSFSDFTSVGLVGDAVRSMNDTAWVKRAANPTSVSAPERKRLRGPFNTHSIFRGITPLEDRGPYISQFLLSGTKGLGKVYNGSEGYIQYGAMRMDQRVRVATPGLDYMTTWESFLDVQNGADCRARETYEPGEDFRFITTPRDLATYVHHDALYQAYLNACVILLDKKVPFDKGIPFQGDDDIDKQQGFALFGGPHILTLVTEVATRALKAVRYQKYNVHRRLRPEAVGGLVERYHNDSQNPLFEGVKPLYDALDKNLLNRIAKYNEQQNQRSDYGNPRKNDYASTGSSTETRLLPMAFPEGSPMHPAYGAGHGAVAGACTTILKAYFDHTHELDFAYVPIPSGKNLRNIVGDLDHKLTVEGELNKICGNICIGRNWGGVHYFSDYRESILLGEKIALGILEEQKLTYVEDFSMTVPLFDGTTTTI